MAKITDVQAAIASLKAEITETRTVIGSAKSLFGGLSAIITDLKQQVIDAKASGDPEALDAVVNGLTQMQTELDTEGNGLAEAIVASTPQQDEPEG
jgi:hypothetical protein